MSATAVRAKILAVSELVRLRKQYGTVLLLCPTLWALFLASNGRPSMEHLFIFVLGSFLMRSAGCALNDIADRNFDRYVERTRTRPLADGRLTVKEAMVVFVVFSALSFVLVLMLNRFTIGLSLVAIVFALVYPFIKRVSFFPQVFLGMAFGWGAVMAWAAVHGEIGLPAVFIFLANVFWATAYDTIYALMDMEDDIRVGVKSTAIFFGKGVYAALAVLYTLTAVSLALAGKASGMGVFYYSGIIFSYVLFLIVAARLRANPTKDVAFKSFLLNAWLGAFILFSIIIDRIF